MVRPTHEHFCLDCKHEHKTGWWKCSDKDCAPHQFLLRTRCPEHAKNDVDGGVSLRYENIKRPEPKDHKGFEVADAIKASLVPSSSG